MVDSKPSKQAYQDVIDLDNIMLGLESDVVNKLKNVYGELTDFLVDNIDEIIDVKTFTLKTNYSKKIDAKANEIAIKAGKVLEDYNSDVEKATIKKTTLDLLRDMSKDKAVSNVKPKVDKPKKKVEKVVIKGLKVDKKKVAYLRGLAKKETKDLERDVKIKLLKAIQANPNIKLAELKTIAKEQADRFTEQRLLTIARTERTNTVNEMRYKAYKDVKTVKGFWFIAILDKKTSDICEHRADVRIPKNYPKLQKEYTPALHVNCRSMLSPILESDTKPLTDTSVLNSIALQYPSKKKSYSQILKSRKKKK